MSAPLQIVANGDAKVFGMMHFLEDYIGQFIHPGHAVGATIDAHDIAL